MNCVGCGQPLPEGRKYFCGHCHPDYLESLIGYKAAMARLDQRLEEERDLKRLEGRCEAGGIA